MAAMVLADALSDRRCALIECDLRANPLGTVGGAAVLLAAMRRPDCVVDLKVRSLGQGRRGRSNTNCRRAWSQLVSARQGQTRTIHVSLCMSDMLAIFNLTHKK